MPRRQRRAPAPRARTETIRLKDVNVGRVLGTGKSFLKDLESKFSSSYTSKFSLNSFSFQWVSKKDSFVVTTESERLLKAFKKEVMKKVKEARADEYYYNDVPATRSTPANSVSAKSDVASDVDSDGFTTASKAVSMTAVSVTTSVSMQSTNPFAMLEDMPEVVPAPKPRTRGAPKKKSTVKVEFLKVQQPQKPFVKVPRKVRQRMAQIKAQELKEEETVFVAPPRALTTREPSAETPALPREETLEVATAQVVEEPVQEPTVAPAAPEPKIQFLSFGVAAPVQQWQRVERKKIPAKKEEPKEEPKPVFQIGDLKVTIKQAKKRKGKKGRKRKSKRKPTAVPTEDLPELPTAEKLEPIQAPESMADLVQLARYNQYALEDARFAQRQADAEADHLAWLASLPRWRRRQYEREQAERARLQAQQAEKERLDAEVRQDMEEWNQEFF